MAIAYTAQQFESYKKRLAKGLVENGLDADSIAENADYKNFISNYVDDYFIKKKEHYALQRIVHRLAHMDITNSNENTSKVYPIVNEYKGHDLQKTMYFSKDSTGAISVITVPVLDSTIVIP